MAELKSKWPPEYYESGEAMPTAEEAASRHSPGFQEKGIAEIRAMMAQQRNIEPTLKYFIETGYRAMNKLLRGQAIRKQDAQRAAVEMVKIDEVLASDFHKRVQPLTVYRGITAEFAKKLEEAYKADGLFSDKGYIIASTVARDTSHLLQIELPVGAPMLSLSKFLSREVLLPHGSRFKVVAYHNLPHDKVSVVAHWLGSP